MGELKVSLKSAVRDIPERETGRSSLKSGRIMKAVQYDSVNGKLIDQDGQHDGPIQQKRYGQCIGGEYATNAAIVGTETVTKPAGCTATVTVSAGRITFGAGIAYDIEMSNGSIYPYPQKLTATTAIWWDTSGNGRHLSQTFANEAATYAFCQSSRLVGSDWLNQYGAIMSNGEYASSKYSLSADTFSVYIPFGSISKSDISISDYINSSNNGSPVISYVNTQNCYVSNKRIDALSAVNRTVNISVTSTGADCGTATVSECILRNSATNSAGQIVLIGNDSTGAGNRKFDNSKILRCIATGPLEKETVVSSTGIHGLEIGWSANPSVEHCHVTRCEYGIVIKGGGYDCSSGGVKGCFIVNMGNNSVQPNGAITLKGLDTIPIIHNFIYQPRYKFFVYGAIDARSEGGIYPATNIIMQNNIILLDNSGNIYNLLNGANVIKARSNFYYAASSTAFNGLGWAAWVAAGRISDPDFERGSIYIRNVSLGSTWQIYNDDGGLVATVGYNPLEDHFSEVYSSFFKTTSLYWGSAYKSPYFDYSEKDFWGNYYSTTPNIGPSQSDRIPIYPTSASRLKYSPSLTGPLFGSSTAYTLPEAPELIEALGADSVWFKTDGTAKTINDATFRANCNGPKLFANPNKPELGVVVYSDPNGPIKAAMKLI